MRLSSSSSFARVILHCSSSGRCIHPPTLRSIPLQPRHRSFATGARGSRGHGWFTNYRSGKGGRHLQGEYFDRESLPECAAWNDAVLQLGCTQVYLDVIVEPRRNATSNVRSKKYIEVPPIDALTGEKHRIVIDVASTVMPTTAQNFVDLMKSDAGVHGYLGTRLYRIEKDVGIYGGDVLTNTGKTGRAAHAVALTIDVSKTDPLPMWHIPGTVTMLVPTVGEIDSRFLLCTQHAPHLDGIARAFGRMNDQSLAIVTKWQTSLLTVYGIPTAFDLIVADCGVLGIGRTKPKKSLEQSS
jgi:cyclophilin family peptidyl-prolyl cis-trans isomerase